MSNRVLLVIDIQEKTMMLLLSKQKFLNNVNGVINYFKKNNLPIIYVKQTNMGELYNQLNYEPADYVVTKEKPSSFTSEEFCQVLNKLNANELVVTGLMSNACIQATCKSALERDIPVTLIEDGHDSIIKPLRKVYNKQLQNRGAKIVSSKITLMRVYSFRLV